MPTVADVADEAFVSRATVYRYFPSQEHLLIDVVLERSIDEIDRAVAAAANQVTWLLASRASHLLFTRRSPPKESGFHSLLQLSIAQSASD